jgi:hypothetical protein
MTDWQASGRRSGGQKRKRPTVTLQIDRLVLRDIDPGRRAVLATSLESELTQLLSAPGVLAALAPGRSVDRSDGGTIRLGGAARPTDLGAAIARAVHRAITA